MIFTALLVGCNDQQKKFYHITSNGDVIGKLEKGIHIFCLENQQKECFKKEIESPIYRKFLFIKHTNQEPYLRAHDASAFMNLKRLDSK